MIFVATKKGRKQIFPPSFVAVVGYKGWIKTRIRDKHHGSETLISVVHTLTQTDRKQSGSMIS
jgi:hypothetical protein